MKGTVLDSAALVMHLDDTVATALEDLAAGRRFDLDDDATVEIVEDVPFGHKFALDDHDVGDEVRKYGQVIGRATEPTAAGAWIHTHNCESLRGRGDLAATEKREESA